MYFDRATPSIFRERFAPYRLSLETSINSYLFQIYIIIAQKKEDRLVSSARDELSYMSVRVDVNAFLGLISVDDDDRRRGVRSISLHEPLFVPFVQSSQVVQINGFFFGPMTHLNALQACFGRCTKVD